jgi:hypothetical protein
MDPVSQVRASLLPILQAWGQELAGVHPDAMISIYDWPVGELTDWYGHDIGIECTFKNAAPEWPDNLALSVLLKHLNKKPSIVSADVVWGHPSGHIEASVLPAPVEFSTERLAELVARLPELFAAFKQAIQRGRPTS